MTGPEPASTAGSPSAAAAPPTADQQRALAKLHDAAQQLEAVFVDMLFKEMRKSAPATSLTGKVSNAEQTFGEMLDQKRAESLAQSGTLGLAGVIERELRSAVLGTPPPPQRGDEK